MLHLYLEANQERRQATRWPQWVVPAKGVRSSYQALSLLRATKRSERSAPLLPPEQPCPLVTASFLLYRIGCKNLIIDSLCACTLRSLNLSPRCYTVDVEHMPPGPGEGAYGQGTPCDSAGCVDCGLLETFLRETDR